MLEQFFKVRVVLERLRTGQVGCILDDFAAFLHARGHCRRGIQRHVRAAAHLGHWLESEDIPLAALDARVARRFLDEHLPRCRCRVPAGEPIAVVRAAVDHLLFQLIGQRVLGRCRTRIEPEHPILKSFGEYLRETRGLAPSTCHAYVQRADAFLASLPASDRVRLGRLSAADLAGYVTNVATRLRPGTTKQVTTALRSFVGYLRLSGLCDAKLARAVPSVAHWKHSHLPSVLSDEELRALSRSFDRRTALGRRDYAIVQCFVLLGLRASEVARLGLEDIDWRSGTVRLTGKPRRVRLLPLPAELGSAIASYLRRGRPSTASRFIFVRHIAPLGAPLASSGVRTVVRAAWRRTGIQVRCRGTRALRYTAATRLLRAGISLKAIADILGHRSIDTTAIYTKVDIGRLAEVPLPWPQTP